MCGVKVANESDIQDTINYESSVAQAGEEKVEKSYLENAIKCFIYSIIGFFLALFNLVPGFGICSFVPFMILTISAKAHGVKYRRNTKGSNVFNILGRIISTFALVIGLIFVAIGALFLVILADGPVI